MSSIDSTDASVLIARQGKLIHRQRLSVLLLVPALIAAGLYAKSEKQRADMWRTDALRLQSQQVQQSQADVAQYQSPLDATYFPVTLIAADGTETPFAGKGLRINLGGKRDLTVDLTRRADGYLFLWAPAKREDAYWNRVVFHPHCANAFTLQLSPVKNSSDEGAGAGEKVDALGVMDSVRYEEGR